MKPSKKHFVKSVRIVHDFHGCESGCCGHRIYGYDNDGNKIYAGDLHFTHPYDTNYKIFADTLVHHEFANNTPSIDFDNCEIYDD